MAVMLEMMAIAATMQCVLDVAGYDSLLVELLLAKTPESARSSLLPPSRKSHPSLRNRGVPEARYRGRNGAMDHLSCKLPSHFGGCRHFSGVTGSSMLSWASGPSSSEGTTATPLTCCLAMIAKFFSGEHSANPPQRVRVLYYTLPVCSAMNRARTSL